MLRINYTGITKEVASEWSELTIEDFHGLFQIIYKYEDKDIENNEIDKLNFLKEYVGFLLKEQKKIVDMMDVKDIEQLVAGTHNLLAEYKPKERDSFEFEGQKYLFPVDIKKQTFGEYIEVAALEKSSKLLKNGKFDVIAEQMARLCKKPEEIDIYLDEETVQERTEQFKKLTMDIVWEFNFFYTDNKKSYKKLSEFMGREFFLNRSKEGRKDIRTVWMVE